MATRFEAESDAMLALVLPVVGHERLTSTAHLRSGGEFLESLIDLVAFAREEHIEIPANLERSIRSEVAAINLPHHPAVEDLLEELALPAA